MEENSENLNTSNTKRRVTAAASFAGAAAIIAIVFLWPHDEHGSSQETDSVVVISNEDYTAQETAVPPLTSDVTDPSIDKKRERALQLINHINFVIYKINSCNDAVVLEEEYKSLNPSSLRLDVIDDKETIKTIQQLLDFLTDMRIDAKEREFLEQDREDAMADLLMDSLPDPTSCISANPWAAAAKVAGAAFTAFNNYERGKKKIEKKFAKDNWQLDKNKLVCLNELNKNLLVNHWKLVKRYKMDDRQRVTEEDINLLMNALKDSNPKRKYQFLVNPDHEKTYAKSPLYWYYRASAAYENDDWKGVIEAARRYQGIYLPILRSDRTAALMAALKLNAMLKSITISDGMKMSFDNDEIRRALDVIDQNARYEDWNLLYLSACLRYSVCNDYVVAERKMADLVRHLESTEECRFVKWRGLLSSDKERKNNLSKAVKERDELEKTRKANQKANKGLTSDEYKRLDKLESSIADFNMDELTMGSKPKVEPLYICRTALMKMRNRHMSREEVESNAKSILDAENTSSHERLFLYGLVRTEDVANKVKGEFEKVSISLSTFPGRVDFIHVKMPYSWFLIPSKFQIVFMASGEEVAVLDEEKSNREIVRDKDDVKLRFRKELDELPRTVDRVMLRFVNNALDFKALYTIPKKNPTSPISGCTLKFEKVEVSEEDVSK